MGPGSTPVIESYAVGQFGRVGGLYIQDPEYVHVIHCNATYSEPLPGGGAEARIAGYNIWWDWEGLVFACRLEAFREDGHGYRDRYGEDEEEGRL